MNCSFTFSNVVLIDTHSLTKDCRTNRIYNSIPFNNRPLMPDNNDLSRRQNKFHLQPRKESGPRFRSISRVSSDEPDTILLSKELLLDESQFLYRTPKPKSSSRHSTYNRKLGGARVPMDVLMMPSLGEAVTGAPIPRLLANPRLK